MRISPDLRKSQLLDGLEQARNGFLDELSSLPPEKRSEVFLGTWSAHDLVAHLIGWDFANIQAARDILADQPVSYTHLDVYKRQSLDFTISMSSLPSALQTV